MKLVAFIVIAIVLFIAAWMRAFRLPRYTISNLSDPLMWALKRLQSGGEGYIIVDAGKKFLQFCPRPGGFILADIPASQFDDMRNRQYVIEDLREMGFSLTRTEVAEDQLGDMFLYQKTVSHVAEARTLTFDVLYIIFKLRETDHVTLITDFEKKGLPT